MGNVRANKVAEQIKQEISDIVSHNIKDPRVGFVTVTGVDVTGDLQEANVYFTVLKQDNREETLEGLNKAKGFIRSEVGKRIRLRKTPDLTFKVDESMEYGNKINRLLHEIKEPEHDNEDF